MKKVNWEELKSLIKENETEAGKEVLVELEQNDGFINEYRLYNRLNAYYRFLSQTEKGTGDDLIKIKYAIKYREMEYAKAMQDDIQELRRCFDAKAYKSTLIMAGSILEAFLLDWLSEIDQEDYFKKSYCKKVVGDGGFESYKATSSLSDYIDAIAEIQAPEWLEEKNKAHKIRKGRNVVHPKCFIKSDREIDEKTCKEVISYLEDIINKRIEAKLKNIEVNDMITV